MVQRKPAANAKVEEKPEVTEETVETPEVEQKAPNAKREATEAKARKTNESGFVFYVSAQIENAPFHLKIGDTKIRGSWDYDRHYVTWKVPTSLADLADIHHHIWSGRILRCKD